MCSGELQIHFLYLLLVKTAILILKSVSDLFVKRLNHFISSPLLRAILKLENCHSA